MAWTVSVANKRIESGVLKFELVYSEDGVEKARQSHLLHQAPAAGWVEEEARRKLAQLTGVATYAANLPATVTPATEPPPADPERSAFLTDLRKLEAVHRLLDLGWVPADNAKVLAFKTSLLNRLQTYWDDLG